MKRKVLVNTWLGDASWSEGKLMREREELRIRKDLVQGSFVFC